MKSFRIILLLSVVLYACKTTRYTPPAITNTRAGYIAAYSDISIREMRRTGIPASIKMAQAILESGDGNSTLARRANNHFGIKCHDWTGRRIYHDDDARNECFRRYSNPEDSFRDHSDFLTGRPRYAGLFKLDPGDYKAWAKGLKAAGYATNPNYDRLLIRIIEENELYKLDSGQGVHSGTRQVSKQVFQGGGKAPASGTREILTRNRIRYIIAKEGDSYESITKAKGLMSWELSRYNDIPANSGIRAGDIIYLQPKRIRAERGSEKHTVNEGETMRYISQLYGVRLDRLLNRNFMVQGQEPSPGDIIYLRKQAPREFINRPLRPEYDL
jgi:hypothetical protein